MRDIGCFMNKGKKIAEELFKPIIGQSPRIKLGYGSFITMNFGKDFPKEIKTRDGLEISYFGEWHLWVYMCAWRLDLLGYPLIGSDDDRNHIETTLSDLKDKKLLEFSVLNSAFDSSIKFESGYELKLFSFNATENKQWIFYTPEEKVFIAGPGKTWSYKSSDK